MSALRLLDSALIPKFISSSTQKARRKKNGPTKTKNLLETHFVRSKLETQSNFLNPFMHNVVKWPNIHFSGMFGHFTTLCLKGLRCLKSYVHQSFQMTQFSSLYPHQEKYW